MALIWRLIPAICSSALSPQQQQAAEPQKADRFRKIQAACVQQVPAPAEDGGHRPGQAPVGAQLDEVIVGQVQAVHRAVVAAGQMAVDARVNGIDFMGRERGMRARQATVAICGKVNHDWLNSPRQRRSLLFVVFCRGGSKVSSNILPGRS